MAARKARHRRIFSNKVVARAQSLKKITSISSTIAEKGVSMKSVISPYLHLKKREAELSNPSNKLFRHYTAVVAAIFVLGSVSPINAFSDEIGLGMNGGYTFDIEEPQIMSDEEGYIDNTNSQTDEADRSSMSDKIVHIVAKGETVSTIAAGYGIKSQTILWENGLANANSLKIGQKLVIPPVDGVTHKVAKGEDLAKIAKKYGIDSELIKKQNSLTDNTLTVGKEIFIPNGKPIADESVASSDSVGSKPKTSSKKKFDTGSSSGAVLDGTGDSPKGDKPFIFPTKGTITQGYRSGHYAFDIANTSKPAIWAAASGTVVKASSGTWGGGYGNHVIIDHGNGLKTLYAHMEYLNVKVGDKVTQGQAIGKMGRTGNVRGRTGIHLHFEVIRNGKKQVPSNYF